MSIPDLVSVSRRYGSDPEYVVAGGGNTSWKTESDLYVKGSGVALEDIAETGFVRMDRKKLEAIWSVSYPSDPKAREGAVLADLLASRRAGEENKRPSVETLLHHIIPYAFVVHTHPALVNGITCSARGEAAARELFGDDALWVPATNPGYVLAKTVKDLYAAHTARTGERPAFILLQNHGIFVAADTVEGVDEIYSRVMRSLDSRTVRKADFAPLKASDAAREASRAVADSLRTLAGSPSSPAAVCFAVDIEIGRLVSSRTAFDSLRAPFTPDHIVYAGSEYLFVDTGSDTADTAAILRALEKAYGTFSAAHRRAPQVVAVRRLGVFGIGRGNNERSARFAVDLFRDAAKIAAYVEPFGGPHFMTQDQIDFINDWEFEAYRSRISAGTK